MEIIKKSIQQTIHSHFQNENCVFLDIETDGLGHRNRIIIMGLIFYTSDTPNQATVYQLFNEDGQSEREILLETKRLFEHYKTDFIISFNGNAFDLPFVNARYKHFNMNYILSKALNIDIMRVANKHKHILNLERYTLKHIERYLNIHRSDTISGKESIILYQTYLENKSPKLKHVILLHNLDDIVNMIPLCDLFTHLKLEKKDIIPLTLVHKQHKYHITQLEYSKQKLSCQLATHLWRKNLEFSALRNGFSIANKGDLTDLKIATKEFSGPQGKLVIADINQLFGINITNDNVENYILLHNQTYIEKNILNVIEKLLIEVDF